MKELLFSFAVVFTCLFLFTSCNKKDEDDAPKLVDISGTYVGDLQVTNVSTLPNTVDTIPNYKLILTVNPNENAGYHMVSDDGISSCDIVASIYTLPGKFSGTQGSGYMISLNGDHDGATLSFSAIGTYTISKITAVKQ